MQIFLTNPTHGKKVAYAEAEAVADVRNGWSVCSQDEYYGTSKETNVEIVKEKSIQASSEEDAPIISKASKKKPGPKPKVKQ